MLTSLQHPRQLLVALNLRDRSVFDIYRIDVETGGVVLEAKNPGDILTWTPDPGFVIRAATAFDAKTGDTVIRVRDAVDRPWGDLVVMHGRAEEFLAGRAEPWARIEGATAELR